MTIPQYGQHVAVSGPSLFWFAIKASRREFGSFPASTCFSISWNCIRGFSMSCSFFLLRTSTGIPKCVGVYSARLCQHLPVFASSSSSHKDSKKISRMPWRPQTCTQSTRICQKAVKIQVYTNIYTYIYI